MNEAPFTCSTQEKAPGLAHKHQNRLSMFAKDKHFSLLRESVNYGQKMFYNIGPWMHWNVKNSGICCVGFTNIFCKSCLRPITSSFFKVEVHNKLCTVRNAMLRNRQYQTRQLTRLVRQKSLKYLPQLEIQIFVF